MKKVFLPSAICLFASYIVNGQTVLYNGGTDITAEANSVIFVDGDVNNDVGGKIHNSGDIYLTNDWINNEPSGCLDPTTGTVWLDGGSEFIKGTQTTTFNNLNCQNGGTKTLNITTIVGGTAGVLQLNSSPFILNSYTLIVTNPLPAAITRTSGYIVSETDPTVGYGVVQWNIGNTGAGNNYIYPFGTVSGSYIPFLFNVTTAGVQSATGALALSTYPTLTSNSPNNRPLPTSVTDLNDASGNEAAAICADRYWVTSPLNYTTNPVSDVTFTYVNSEWDNSGGSTNNIVEDSLLAWRWNGAQWQNPSTGADNTASHSVTTNSVNAFTIWTLKGAEPVPPPPCGDFWLPNAFSPNSDGKNDHFRPRSNCIKTLDFRIYNRWGNLIYTSSSPTDLGWDGSIPGKGKDGNEGVYAYELKATLLDNTQIVKNGLVTLLK